MSPEANYIFLAIFANAFVSFLIFMFWQMKVIITIYGISDSKNAHVPWKALNDPDSPQSNFGHFINGEILPDLRRKWLKAVAYVVVSTSALFIWGP